MINYLYEHMKLWMGLFINPTDSVTDYLLTNEFESGRRVSNFHDILFVLKEIPRLINKRDSHQETKTNTFNIEHTTKCSP